MVPTLMLLVLISVGARAGCPSGFSGKACESYEQVEIAFASVSHRATYAIIQAILSFSAQSSQLYQTTLAVFEHQATTELRTGNLTPYQAEKMLKELAVALRQAKAAQGTIATEAMQAMQMAQRETISALEAAATSQAVLTGEAWDEADFAVPDAQIKALIGSAHQKVEDIVKKAVEKVNAGWSKVQGFLEQMLNKVAKSQVFQEVKRKVLDMIKYIKEKVTGNAERSIQSAFDDAVYFTNRALFALEMHDGRSKRSLQDLWKKVTDAVKKIGGKVYETVEKVLEENKPQIMDALNKLGKVLISVGKKIAIEIAGEIVKASLA